MASQVLAGRLHPLTWLGGGPPAVDLPETGSHASDFSLDAGNDLLALQHPLQQLEVQPVYLGAQGRHRPILPGLVKGEASCGMSLHRAPDVTLAAASPRPWGPLASSPAFPTCPLS